MNENQDEEDKANIALFEDAAESEPIAKYDPDDDWASVVGNLYTALGRPPHDEEIIFSLGFTHTSRAGTESEARHRLQRKLLEYWILKRRSDNIFAVIGLNPVDPQEDLSALVFYRNLWFLHTAQTILGSLFFLV